MEIKRKIILIIMFLMHIIMLVGCITSTSWIVFSTFSINFVLNIIYWFILKD